MRHKIIRVFFDHEKEETWLNSLSDQGLILVKYFWVYYVFEDGEPGKYCYGIEFMEHRASHPVSTACLKFLEDLGIETIATWMYWVYLRKEKDGKPFELYTDLGSKIRKMKRISRWWFSAAAFEYAMAVYEMFAGFYMSFSNTSGHHFSWVLFIAAISLFIFGTFFLNLGLPIHRRMKKLLKETTIYEE